VSVCYAAGGANLLASVGADQLPLVERWTPGGDRVRVTLPTLPGSAGDDLYGISCTSAGQCAAVGSYENPAATLSGLIEQLNGSAWRVTAAPGSASGQLSAVSCPSASLCVAVGSLGRSSLAERWSGGRWTAATPPGPPASQGLPWLDDVSCPSTTRCVAVGGTESHAVVDTLDGATWMMTANDGPGFNVGHLYAVSCFSASVKAMSCAAVGNTIPVGGNSKPLSAFLSGSTWSIVPTV
jgi:hypothetical protein